MEPLPFKPQQIEPWPATLDLRTVLDLERGEQKQIARANSPTQQPVSGQSNLTNAGLWFFTSGTTGPPKPVRHTWAALTRTVRFKAPFQSRRWLLAYDPSSFAGLQVWLQALLAGGSVHDVSRATPRETAQRMVQEQIEFASGTPTFWRMLLGAVPREHWSATSLEQITLGGEAVSPGTLAALQATFPRARCTHIYATSELGVCFSVSDGLAGFPAEYLRNPPSGCALRVTADGELEVRPEAQAAEWITESDLVPTNRCASGIPPATNWRGTGDLVEQRGERVYFLGRKSGSINVGGSKVLPEEVEAIIRDVPGVAEVRISAQASSVLGALVRADIQPLGSADLANVRTAVLAACQAQLPRFKIPALIEFHTQLPRTATGKIARPPRED
jgi:acyl-CoA synthetase (AMP-forming)/AMP-acid ligase II